MLKPACIVGAVNFSGSHSRVALSRATAQMKNLTGSTTSSSTSTAETDEFFSFSVSGNELAESDTSSVSLECLQYLEDKSTSLDCLHKFPTIRKMFIMYNLAIPSSAPVERLFFLCGYGFDEKSWVHDR